MRWCVCASCRKCLGAAWVAGLGLALPASVVKPRGSLEAVLSPRAIWILYLAAGGPQCLGTACLPSQDPSFRGFGEAEVCPVGAVLPWEGFLDIGHTGLSLRPLWPKEFFFLGLKDQEEKTEIFLSGPKGPNLLDSRTAMEGKHSGYQSSDEMVK